MADAAKIILAEGDAPATPAAGTSVIYAKTDHIVYTKDADGVEHVLGYIHPTGDGNIHVPANSTTNSGKVLTAGAVAGTYTWEAAASGGHVIEDEGTPLASRSSLNFTGAGVTVTDDSENDVTVVTINTGGEGGLSVVEAQNTGHVLTIADDNGKTFTCDSTVSRTFDLPSVSAGDVGAEFSFVKLGVGALVIHAADSDTIEDCGAGLTMYCADEGIATVSIKLVTETQWVIKSAATGTWITTV